MLREKLVRDHVSVNRATTRKLRKGHIKRATAFLMAGLLTVSGALLQVGTLTFAADDANKVLAFPTAEGGGRYATGGRAQTGVESTVYVVTSLEDYSTNKGDTPIPGTLRYGIETSDPTKGTIIVFNVGGVIQLKDSLRFANTKNITVAGQTAPGDGITLSGYDTNISDSENLIIRFVRFRPGAVNVHNGSDGMDALWGRDNDTFILDHCSFSWNTDETLSTYRGKNGTVQWCIISESLTLSGHSKGRHGYGGISGGDNVVFQYNLYANHTSRNPRMGGGYDGYADADHIATVQMSNNVLYNWGFNTCYGGGYTWTNYINNYLKEGIGTRDEVANRIIDAGESSKVGGFYIAGNYSEGHAAESADNLSGMKFSGVSEGENKTTISDKAYEAEGFNSITLVSAQEAYQQVLDKAGATYPYRDAIDARVVAETVNDLGRYVNTEHEVGGYASETVTREASFDTDMDGIPDTWEASHGLNANDATDSVKIDATTGYAYVELYFNELVNEVVKTDYVAPNPDVTIDLADNAQIKVGETVKVTATVTAKNNASVAKVEFYNGSELVGTDDTAPYEFEYKNLADDTYYISARAYDSNGFKTQSTSSRLHVNGTGALGEWTSTDIGTPGVAGNANITEDGVLVVKGAGKIGKSEGSTEASGDLHSAKTDNFQYVYKKVTGDAEFVTRIDYIEMVDNHAFNGIMFRESLDTGSKAAGLSLSIVKINSKTIWSSYVVAREETNGNISDISETIDSKDGAAKVGIPLVSDINFKTGAEYNGAYLKFVRSGDKFTGYVSEDGKTWIEIGSKTVDMAEEVYVGFAVDANKVANDIENLSTAKFSNYSIATEFAPVEYVTQHLTVTGASSTAVGSEFVVSIEEEKNYLLPETVSVTVNGNPIDFTYDAKEGIIKVAAGVITTKDKITVTAIATPDPDAGALAVPSIAGDTTNGSVTTVAKESITVSNAGGNINKAVAGESTATYLLFPENKYADKMTVEFTIDSIVSGNEKGVFVGAFQTSGDMLFDSFSFRDLLDAKASQAISPYWVKSAEKGAGNGSPKNPLDKTATYKVVFEKDDSGLIYKAEVFQNGTSIGTKDFKANEGLMNAETAGAQYGIAVADASVKITKLVFEDTTGVVLYDLATYEEKVFTYQTVGETIKVNTADGSINVKQEGGRISSKYGEAGTVEYLVFPKNEDVDKMTVDITVNSVEQNKNAGVFIGAFQTEGSYFFNSICMRGTGDASAVSPYWVKADKIGNGSPKLELTVGAKYTIVFEKDDTGLVHYAQIIKDGTVLGEKTFKSSEVSMTAEDKSARYGIAVGGADVTITAWTVTDVNGAVLFDLAGAAAPEQPEQPTEKPTETPTEKPTETPTEKPTETPTEKPSETPTEKPTETPTEKPSENPTEAPTTAPSTDVVVDGVDKEVVKDAELSADVKFEGDVKVEDVKLVIEKAVTSVVDTVKAALETAGVKVADVDAKYYDISLKAGDKVAKLTSGKVEITFAWAEGKSADKNDVKVYHYDGSKAEEVKATVTADGITIEADEFSPYVVVYSAKTVDAPGTADTAPVVFYIALCAMMLAAGVVVCNKKRA